MSRAETSEVVREPDGASGSLPRRQFLAGALGFAAGVSFACLAPPSRGGLRIAVAHQVRLAPNILFLKQHLADGLIGELLEIRAQGKQDHRAGGEDLVVLGVHLFDLLRFFAGDPLWCAARVLQASRESTLSDARPATENIGPVAGDDIFAQFAFPQGVNATFTSRIRNRELAEPWSMELLGTKGAVKIIMDMVPTLYARKWGELDSTGQGGRLAWFGQRPRAWANQRAAGHERCESARGGRLAVEHRRQS